MPAKQLPSREELAKWLRYDSDSGRLFWIAQPNWSILIGDEAITASTSRGYRRGKVLGGMYMAHRIVWKLAYDADPPEIDHIDGDRGNNRLDNLRAVGREINCRNCKPVPSASGIRSVYRSGRKWIANYRQNGGVVHLGTFISPVEAMTVRHLAALQAGYRERIV